MVTPCTKTVTQPVMVGASGSLDARSTEAPKECANYFENAGYAPI